jgi:hypothetical protein
MHHNMTSEYIHRIVDLLTKHEISYVVTGGASEFIRQTKKITLDFDVLVKRSNDNYSRIDEMIKYLNHKGIASEALFKGKIVRLNIFPFKVDILPRLDGLDTNIVIEEMEFFRFQGIEIPLISVKNLEINYQNIKHYE